MRRYTLKHSGLFLAAFLSLSAAIGWAASSEPQADPKTRTMPIGWNQAWFKVISSPDYAALEKGEVLYDMKQLSGDSAVAQTIGLVKASPEACFKAARDYNNYTKTMPYTVESRVVRSFNLEGGENAGAEAVDFWTRVSVLGFETRYLLRIAHLSDPAKRVYRSLWTLVRDPAQIPCVDAEKRPCENDLATNLGSHQFEPYKGDPTRTLHTYTLKLVGKSWVQRTALTMGGGSSMRDVTLRVRKSAEGK